jgi:hypothetical protein
MPLQPYLRFSGIYIIFTALKWRGTRKESLCHKQDLTIERAEPLKRK